MSCTTSVMGYVVLCDATDEELQELESQVQSHIGSLVRGLQVGRAPQGLVLRGQSRTYYGKQLAQAVLLNSTELRLVANEIDVI